jgi:hypothetical protein
VEAAWMKMDDTRYFQMPGSADMGMSDTRDNKSAEKHYFYTREISEMEIQVARQ